jgi:hypothetical protein
MYQDSNPKGLLKHYVKEPQERVDCTKRVCDDRPQEVEDKATWKREKEGLAPEKTGPLGCASVKGWPELGRIAVPTALGGGIPDTFPLQQPPLNAIVRGPRAAKGTREG